MRGKPSSERICSFLETKQISLEKESVKASISLTTLAHESSEGNHGGSAGVDTVFIDLYNVSVQKRDQKTNRLAKT